MALSELHSLSKKNVDDFVTKTSAGVYVLDRSKDSGFTVHYCGRSDDDVHARLLKHVDDGKYLYFKFEYQSSAKAAFEEECRLYHEHKPPDNIIHPDRPKNTSYACPVSGCHALS